MLFHVAALATLLATRVAGEAVLQGPNEKWMDSRMKELEKSIIDWNNSPTALVHQETEESCSERWAPWSTKTKFKVLHRLVQPSDKHGKSSPARFKIYPIIVSQKTPENNFGDTPITLSVERAKAKIDTESRGWNAGTQMNAPFGSSGGGVSLSASYNQEHTTGTTETDSTGARWDCPPGHRCEIQSWTLHLMVTGTCARMPIIKSLGIDINPCTQPEELDCSQFKAFREKECPSSGGYRQENCTVRTPLINHDGTPVAENVYIMTKLTVHKAPKVVSVRRNWLKLDTGKLYNPVSRKFKDSPNGKKYTADDEPTPELPEGAKFRKVEGSRLLLNDGTWLDQDTGKPWKPQAPPRVLGYKSGGWLRLSNGYLYNPETDKYWDEKKKAPVPDADSLPRPDVPKGTVAVGFSHGLVKVKDGGWIDPDFGGVLSKNATRDELRRYGVSIEELEADVVEEDAEDEVVDDEEAVDDQDVDEEKNVDDEGEADGGESDDVEAVDDEKADDEEAVDEQDVDDEENVDDEGEVDEEVNDEGGIDEDDFYDEEAVDDESHDQGNQGYQSEGDSSTDYDWNPVYDARMGRARRYYPHFSDDWSPGYAHSRTDRGVDFGGEDRGWGGGYPELARGLGEGYSKPAGAWGNGYPELARAWGNGFPEPARGWEQRQRDRVDYYNEGTRGFGRGEPGQYDAGPGFCPCLGV